MVVVMSNLFSTQKYKTIMNIELDDTVLSLGSTQLYSSA